MTEEEGDRAHEVYQLITISVDMVVSALLEAAKLTQEQEDTVRDMLNEQYRFWE